MSKDLFHPKYWILWLLIVLFWLVVQLPHRLRLAIVRWVAHLALFFYPRGRRVTEINVKMCFPELSSKQQRELVIRSIESTAMGLIEAGMAWWLPAWRLKNFTTPVGVENMYKALEQNKGVIALGLHLAPLEITGRLSAFYEPFHAIYQKPKNPVFDWLLTSYRKRIYGKIIPNNDMRAVMKSLANNEVVWYAPDQSASTKRSVFVPFFGVEAATTTATSDLARLSGSPVLPVAGYRNPDLSGYTIEIFPQLENFPSGDVEADTRLINETLEMMIRKHPEQYIWQYKRFKMRRDGKANVYDGGPGLDVSTDRTES